MPLAKKPAPPARYAAPPARYAALPPPAKQPAPAPAPAPAKPPATPPRKTSWWKRIFFGTSNNRAKNHSLTHIQDLIDATKPRIKYNNGIAQRIADARMSTSRVRGKAEVNARIRISREKRLAKLMGQLRGVSLEKVWPLENSESLVYGIGMQAGDSSSLSLLQQISHLGCEDDDATCIRKAISPGEFELVPGRKVSLEPNKIKALKNKFENERSGVRRGMYPYYLENNTLVSGPDANTNNGKKKYNNRIREISSRERKALASSWIAAHQQAVMPPGLARRIWEQPHLIGTFEESYAPFDPDLVNRIIFYELKTLYDDTSRSLVEFAMSLRSAQKNFKQLATILGSEPTGTVYAKIVADISRTSPMMLSDVTALPSAPPAAPPHPPHHHHPSAPPGSGNISDVVKRLIELTRDLRDLNRQAKAVRDDINDIKAIIIAHMQTSSIDVCRVTHAGKSGEIALRRAQRTRSVKKCDAVSEMARWLERETGLDSATSLDQAEKLWDEMQKSRESTEVVDLSRVVKRLVFDDDAPAPPPAPAAVARSPGEPARTVRTRSGRVSRPPARFEPTETVLDDDGEDDDSDLDESDDDS